MTVERTFSIVKPNAVANNDIGAIYARFERAGFKIIAAKMLRLTREQAEGFYAEHKGRPFFDGLVEFMTSGPIMVQVLESENAVQRNLTSWAQPTRTTPWPAPCVPTTRTASPLTPFTVPTPLNPHSAKSLTSSTKAKSAHVNRAVS